MVCELSNDGQITDVAPLRISHSVERGSQVTIHVDGAPWTAYVGESVASALLAGGKRHLRHSPRAGTPRGFFCHMGTCQECVVVIDGVRRPACQTPVQEGMSVKTGGRP